MQNSDEVGSKSEPVRVIARRYELVREIELGRGSRRKLWLATDKETDTKVVVRVVDLEFEEGKAIERFEREGRALQSMEHPNIPDYVDAFHETGQDGSASLYLVRKAIGGTPLSAKIESGEILDEDDAREFLARMLRILDYLASLNPPVVHRDINPTNIIVRPDGAYALVNFAAAQMPAGGSTVGQTGFMPPEQLERGASPASDIYSLGATVWKSMTGTDPAELEPARLKSQFREHSEVSNAFLAVLERMLDPAVETRFQSASEVLEALDAPSTLQPSEASGAVENWREIEARLEELRMNPPTVPRSAVDVSRHQLTAIMGPFRPGAINWFIYLTLICAVIVPPLIWFPDWWFVGPPAALLLTFLFRRQLSPTSERLQITPDEIVVEKSWDLPLFGTKSRVQRIVNDLACLPQVYRLAEAYEAYHEGRGQRPGVGYEGLVFTSFDGQKATFGIALMNKHKIIDEAGRDDRGELDWLAEIVTEYVRYLRDETGEDENE